MNIPNEVIFTVIATLSTVIVFLFKNYRDNLNSLRKEMHKSIKELVDEVKDLRDQRADLMHRLGTLEGENKALRERINFLENMEDSESEKEEGFL